jgi:hypothetical protein
LDSGRRRDPTNQARRLFSRSTGLEARMSITIVVLIIVALLSIGVRVHRMRRGGSFFWWSGKDEPNTREHAA